MPRKNSECVVSNDGGKTWTTFKPKRRANKRQTLLRDEYGNFYLRVSK